MRAIRVAQYGGPEVLALAEVPAPEPGPGQVRVRIEAAGVNFIDVYQRTGRYAGELPFTPGVEATGVVDAVGPGVTDVALGDAVVYAMQRGAYAEQAVVPAASVVPRPASLDPRAAAALMLQGMTAHFLAFDVCPALAAGDTVLLHAAAGGVGLLLAQLLRERGVRTIGTVSTEAKAQLARAAGVDEVVLYTQQDFEPAVTKLTAGRGVRVVFDSVGRTTFDKSLKCLARRGYLVLFGASSGAVEPFDPLRLSAGGSLYLTRPTLGDYVADRPALLARAREVFDRAARGALAPRIERTYALADTAQAHRDLESRATSGKLLIVP